jgi:putative PIN family toxin of toxin-antitoxin system
MSERSRRRLRVVIDTNLFVSGMTNRIGLPRQLLRNWFDERVELLLSGEQHAELIDVFGRPAIIQRYQLGFEELAELFAGLSAAERITPASPLPLAVRDPKDEPILATALDGKADYLVTGDKDLLVLAGDPRLGTLRIVTVAEFLAILAESERTEADGDDRRGAQPDVQNGGRES